MKLIRELNESEIHFITENCETSGEKQFFIEGIFMQADVKNRNGRIYPKPIMESELNRYSKDFVSRKRALGELGHPNGPKINEDRVSHLITELSMDGPNVMGKAKILNTPHGKIVKEFMKEGVVIGVSSRAVGSVKQNSRGVFEVQSDFRLATIDIVSDPSGPECFVNGIMENVDWIFDESMNGWKSVEYAANVQKQIHENIDLSEAKQLEIFRNFLSKL
jgi:hypothetical protein